MKIFKYPFNITNDEGFYVFSIPDRSRILCVQDQDGKICMWAEVSEDFPTVERKFQILGTGKNFTVELDRFYIGSVQQESFVWHVYEIGSRLEMPDNFRRR